MKIQPRYLIALSGVALVVIVLWIFRDVPVRVDTDKAVRGPMQTVVEEEGVARYVARYKVNTPVAGYVRRFEVREGDSVSPGASLIVVEPIPLSLKERTLAEARGVAAEARMGEMRAHRLGVESEYGDAVRDRQRVQRLFESGGVSETTVAGAELRLQTALRALEAARFAEAAALGDLEAARSVLEATGRRNRLEIAAPAAGRVLRIFEENDRVVSAGTPLVEIGDPSRVEVALDVLSEDAVKIAQGAPVSIEGWGGETLLRGAVRMVEPYARTRLSTLGVEEQRVEVVADLTDPPPGLGSGYRVVGKIVVWSGENVLHVPPAALFRIGDGWGVFTVRDGRDVRKAITIGHRAGDAIEILDGIREGDTVVLHPPNELEDGTMVQPSGSDVAK